MFHVKHRSARQSPGVKRRGVQDGALHIAGARRRRQSPRDPRRRAEGRRPRPASLREPPPTGWRPRRNHVGAKEEICRGGRRRCRAPGVRDSRHSARRFRAIRRCRREPAQLGPHRGEPRRVDPGWARRSAAERHPILVDRDAVAAQRGRAEAQFGVAAAPASSAAIFAAKARARRLDRADAEPQRVSRWSALSARGQPVLGARGEHAIGLGGPAGHQIVDEDADIGVGPVEHRATRTEAASAALSPAISPCAAASS